MKKPLSPQASLPVPPAPVPSVMRLRVVEAAGGDPAVAAQLRGMMWDAYCQAGCPLGQSEDAMFEWWEFGQNTRVN